MRTVKGQLFRAWIATVLAVSGAFAVDSPFTGAFLGTGRSCYGGLYIRTKTISWLTPFSQCQRVPYEVIDRREKGNQRAFVFHLKQHAKSCGFDVLYLHHPDTPNLDIDWEIIGYVSLESYETDKKNGYKATLPNSMSCSLVTR
jgi:hypothetical protein